MTTHTASIPLSSIDTTTRGRKTYTGIEELANSILEHGLIQPVILAPHPNEESPFPFLLIAGGRRLEACKYIEEATAAWETPVRVSFLHGLSSLPGSFGYVLKDEIIIEETSGALSNLLAEIAENRNRVDLDWREELPLIVEAFRLSKIEANVRGERLSLREFGSMAGVQYMDLQAAVAIYDDYQENPSRYAEATGVRQAVAVKMKYEADEIAKLAATKSFATTPATSADRVQFELRQESPTLGSLAPTPVVVDLSSSFFNRNGLDVLAEFPEGSLNHVICDPDYAIDVANLGSNMSAVAVADGVAQANVADSLSDLYRLIATSFRAVDENGFLVFFYDLDHHEKLLRHATACGWKVQRWPLIWEKSDFNSNGAAQYNFIKNIEYAMVCRKPGATLQKSQQTSIFRCAGKATVKLFGHPFAKPEGLWHFILQAVAIPGQTIYDPFAGSGSCPIAAATYGMKVLGSEINPTHFSTLISNLKSFYRRAVGEHVTFS